LGGTLAASPLDAAAKPATQGAVGRTKQKGAKDVLLQASPEKIKNQQEDSDRAMKEFQKEKAAAAAGSQKKSKKKKAGGQGTASACKTAPAQAPAASMSRAERRTSERK
jgi:hypothetical protein